MKSRKPKRLIFWTTILLSALIIPLQFAGEAQGWWNSNYLYRKQITVRNNDSIQLTANTIVSFNANTAELITGGKVRSDGKDWRIVYNNAGTESEIAQLVETGWNTPSTETWFRLQAAINAGATDGNYYVYYGYSGESGSPSTFTTSEAVIVQQTNGSSPGAEALDFEDTANGEYGGAQSVSVPAGTSRYWKITKFSFYVWYKTSYEAPCSSSNDFAAFIFDGTGKKEGDQITEGKSDVKDGDDFITNYNDLVWSGNKPKIKTGTWYFAVLPSNPAQRNKSGCWIRWDYISSSSGAYQIDRAGTWHTANIGADKRRRYQLYGREAANSDLSASLGGEQAIKRWGEGTCGASCEYTSVTEDAYLDQLRNNWNLGAETEVRVGDEDGTRADRTLIKFNLSDLSGLIRNSSQIISARLRVRTINAQAGGGSINVDAFRVKKTWNEGIHLYSDQTASANEVTWTYQLYNTTAWTGAGCDNSADRETTADATVAVSASETWYSWDVTNSVKYMFNNPSQYYGWILKSQSEGTTNCWRFYSSEHGTSARRPYLEIVYDNAATAIYYSVGTETNPLYSNTASASSGLLTLDSPAANNIGVGDEITEGSNKYYIRGRNSSTQFTIQTATGGTNISFGPSASISIKRAFDKLSTAYSNSSNLSHLNTSDLVAGNFQLNWVCYADNVMDDTLTLSQAGYTTGPNNYIKVYTPTSTSEVGTSQRHNGTWGSGFRILPSSNSSAITVTEDYVRIEGIAIQATSAGVTAALAIVDTNGGFSVNNDIRVSHCLLVGQLGVVNSRGIYISDASNNRVNVTVWNTIAYNHQGLAAFHFGDSNTGYCYNCTAYKSYYGIGRWGGTIIVKNSIAMDKLTGGSDYAGGIDASSDYNMSSDTTAPGTPGTHNLKSKSAANQFLSITGGSEDLHLTPGADAKNAGTSLSSIFTDDIDGQTRYGTWDMGADEENSFEYRRAITIDHTKVESSCGSNDLLHFPVLISLSNQTWLKTTTNSGKIYHVTQAGGFDIPCDLIFRASDGRTKLDHEVEKYDGTNGSLVAWVRIPALSKAADTTIYMYYGNPEITTNLTNPSGVWDSNFVGVWHLREDPSGGSPQMKDSKGSNHGTYHGNDASGDQVSAQVNGGLDLDGDPGGAGDKDYIDAVNSGSSLNVGQTFTAEMWIKRKTTGGSDEDSLLTKVHGNYYSFKLNITTANNLQMWVNDGGTSVTGGTITDTSDFHYIGGYSDGTNLKVFRDGDIDAGSGSTPSITYDSSNLLMGVGIWNGSLQNYTDATIDEVRVSSSARDACWIKTTYNTIKNPGYIGSSGKFYSVQDPADGPAPTGIELNSFTAMGDVSAVLVQWQTKTEVDNLGFNLYRSTERDGTYTKLNSSLIPGLLSSVKGKRYSFTDANVTKGKLYYYKLEDVDLNGTRMMHGPVCVDWDRDGIPDDVDPDVKVSDSAPGGGSGGGGSSGGGDSLGGDFWDYGDSTVTRVSLKGFKAQETPDGVLVEWQTGYEVDNLGFHLYREVDGELLRLTPELVAGSALLAGSGISLRAGHQYQWWDVSAIADDEREQSSLEERHAKGATRGSAQGALRQENTGLASSQRSAVGGRRSVIRYWLEDVDLNGKRTMHGPVEIQPSAPRSRLSASDSRRAELMSEFGKRLDKQYEEFWKIQDLKEKLKNVTRYSLLGKTNNESRVTNNAALGAGQPSAVGGQYLALSSQLSALSSQLIFSRRECIRFLRG